MAHYSLVVHAVDQHSADVWIGSLDQYNHKPENCRLVCFPTGTQPTARSKRTIITAIEKSMWKRPFSDLKKRFYYLQSYSDLQPGSAYTVRFEAKVVQPNGGEKWQSIKEAQFVTLPDALPGAREKPFTVALGSCYYAHYDGGQTARAYKALYDQPKLQPDITFLVGDQVYLDINLLFPLNKEDTCDRIADNYARHWLELGSVMSRGGTWMLPDDHELWNNYPVTAGLNPWIQALRHKDKFRRQWEKTAKEGIRNVQRVEPLRTFDIGDDLSFCILDTRTDRKVDKKDRPTQFIGATHFKRLIRWIEQLDRPGVLVTQQPLLDRRGKRSTDYTMANFKQQYAALVKAIAACDHDIVVLSGDVHYGRISEVKIGEGSGRLIEVISSPMSNLTGVNSFASSSHEKHKESEFFPVNTVAGVTRERIKRVASVTVEEDDYWDLRYLQDRTKEHFMTLSFAKKSSESGITLKIQAWHIRERTSKGLPKREYKKAIEIDMT